MSPPPVEPDLLRLIAAIVRGDWGRVEELRRSRGPAPLDRRWREAVLQTHLFAGFPRTVEALAVLERAGDSGTPEADEVDEHSSPDAGRALFDTIYGESAAPVRETLRRLHPRLADWIGSHAYGAVLTRPGAGAAERELWAVAALVALDQPRQLTSHARGALRCGAGREELMGVIRALEGELDEAVVERGAGVLATVLAS